MTKQTTYVVICNLTVKMVTNSRSHCSKYEISGIKYKSQFNLMVFENCVSAIFFLMS